MKKNTRSRTKDSSRRAFLSAAIAAPVLAANLPSLVDAAAEDLKLVSPDGSVRFELYWRGQPALSYRVMLRGRPIIETSPLGIIVDGVNLSEGAEVGRVETYRVREKYPSRGVHAAATNYCHGAKLSVTHRASKTADGGS